MTPPCFFPTPPCPTIGNNGRWDYAQSQCFLPILPRGVFPLRYYIYLYIYYNIIYILDFYRNLRYVYILALYICMLLFFKKTWKLGGVDVSYISVLSLEHPPVFPVPRGEGVQNRDIDIYILPAQPCRDLIAPDQTLPPWCYIVL